MQLHGVVDDRWPFVPRERVMAFVKGEWAIAEFVEFGRDEFDYVVAIDGRLYHTQAVRPCGGTNTSTPQ